MTKEEFVERMTRFDIDCVMQQRTGMCGISPDEVWDIISDPNFTEEMWEARKDDVTIEELREYKKILSEEMKDGYWRCCALTAKGERCNGIQMSGSHHLYDDIKDVIKASKHDHYCPKHKQWKDPLFKHASLVTIEEKNNKKRNISKSDA